jgi:hypothetical protein
MSTLTTAKTIEVLFENTLETFEYQDMMLDKVDFVKPNPAKMQNAGNFYWETVNQRAVRQSGWDMSSKETEIIKETYPLNLGTPWNDVVKQPIRELRDKQFWTERGKEAGRELSQGLNTDLATAIKNQGALYYRNNATSGYDFIAEGQAMMNERQLYNSQRYYMINDRDNLKFAKDLAARQTLQGQPDKTWGSGQIGNNIAGFDVYQGSFLPALAGGAAVSTTVTSTISEEPEAGGVTAAGVATNVDYRVSTFAVAATASYNVGDKVTFSNGGTTVKALGLGDKINTNQAMIFTIVAKPSGTSVSIYPKPIALDDAGLTTLQKNYANIDTQILATATMDRINSDASAQSNLFWDKSAICVTGGTIPAELYKELAGKKYINSTMKNGLDMYMIYDGDILTTDFTYRMLVWYGITVKNPSNCGVAVTY